MKTTRRFGIVLASALALGCEGKGDKSIQINVNSIDVPPGTEVQLCYYMKAPNTEPFDFGHVNVDFTPGTHHAHIYYSDAPRENGVEDCFNSVDFERWHLIVAAHTEKLDWELPQGVAFQLKPHQQLLVQLHYVNGGILLTENNRGSGSFRLDARKPGEVREYMGAVFGQQRAIDIPANSQWGVEGICKLPRAVDVAAYAGHYHFRGVAAMASKIGPSGLDAKEFYRTTLFADPEFAIYPDDAPMHFDSNERIMWRCNYDNPTPMNIQFGPAEFTHEHCNMFVFYHPAGSAQEFTPCVSWGRCPTPCAQGQVCSPAGTCVAQ